MSDQVLEQIRDESLRLQNYSELIQLCWDREKNSMTFKQEAIKVLAGMHASVADIWKPFTKETQATWTELNEELKKHLGGLGISEAERKEIVKAMGMGRGSWYQCPNGHVYAIGECHGAMQRSRCPDCGSAIGGMNHRLEDSNQASLEMDGASNRDYQWMQDRFRR